MRELLLLGTREGGESLMRRQKTSLLHALARVLRYPYPEPTLFLLGTFIYLLSTAVQNLWCQLLAYNCSAATVNEQKALT